MKRVLIIAVSIFVLILAIGSFVLLRTGDPIADNPCRILKMDESGKFTVTPVLQNGSIIPGEHDGYLQGVGRINLNSSEVAKKFITQHVDLDYVCAAKDGEGLHILYLDKGTTTVRDLNADLSKLLIEMGSSGAVSP